MALTGSSSAGASTRPARSACFFPPSPAQSQVGSSDAASYFIPGSMKDAIYDLLVDRHIDCLIDRPIASWI